MVMVGVAHRTLPYQGSYARKCGHCGLPKRAEVEHGLQGAPADRPTASPPGGDPAAASQFFSILEVWRSNDNFKDEFPAVAISRHQIPCDANRVVTCLFQITVEDHSTMLPIPLT